MSNDRDIILFRVDRKAGILLAGVLAVVLGGFALSEQLTLTTSYPVPSGIYNQLITTGNSGTVPADTTFNRNAGNTILVPATNPGGMVGIGTTSPGSKLDVAGTVRIADGTQGDGRVLTSDASGLATWRPASAGGIPQGLAVFQANGNFTVPVGVVRLWVEVYGGGGGGGDGATAVAGGNGLGSSFLTLSATGGGGGSGTGGAGSGGVGSGGQINQKGGGAGHGTFEGYVNGMGGSNMRGGGGKGGNGDGGPFGGGGGGWVGTQEAGAQAGWQ